MTFCASYPGRDSLVSLLANRQDIAVHPADALSRPEPPFDLYFYRPGELLVPRTQVAAFEQVAESIGIRFCEDGRPSDGAPDAVVKYFIGARDDLDTVIRRLEHAACDPLGVTPNHVLFACDAWAFEPANSPSLPAPEPVLAPCKEPCGREIVVAVIDTGLPAHFDSNALLKDMVTAHGDLELFDYEGSDVLSGNAGHGTFVAGVVRLAAPCVSITVDGVFLGRVTDDQTVAAKIGEVLLRNPRPMVINLSLGGFTKDNRAPLALESVLSKIAEDGPVVVAASGNNHVSTANPHDPDRLFWPAAFRSVVGVGAVGRTSGGVAKAPFSNQGPWVKACAVGVDVVSSFEDHPYLPAPAGPQVDFEGFAVWSGTSFAAPYVAGAIANLLCANGDLTPNEAWQRVQASPTTVPDLGVFVK